MSASYGQIALARHFLEVDDLTSDDLTSVLDLAEDAHRPDILARRGVALIFEKPSLRTRNSMETAVVELGGHPLSMKPDELGLGTREPTADVARVLSRYHAAICARVFAHQKLEEMAAVATVPVVNLLSDYAHPCQALADLLTLRQRFRAVKDLTVAWVGDYNNVARSLATALALSGAEIRIASPNGYGPTDSDLDRLRRLNAEPAVTTRPHDAADGADAVCTDVWASMGQEAEAIARRRAFEGFTVDDKVMGTANRDAIFLHCLPAHRGEEVAASVVDGPQSAVWDQAENRLHSARGLLRFLLGETGADR